MKAKTRFRIPRYPAIITSVLFTLAIVTVSVTVILYGRGYRIKLKDDPNFVAGTALLSATSDPTGAEVTIDGKLLTATNNSVTVEPGEHSIMIAKDGYLPWQKSIIFSREVVHSADAFLFPLNPGLSALTSTGVIKPHLSPDRTKIVFFIPPKNPDDSNDTQGGIWIYDMSPRTLSLSRDMRRIATWNITFARELPDITWSPDSSEILVSSTSINRLYSIASTDDYETVSVTTILNLWQQEAQDRQSRQLTGLASEFEIIASHSASIIAFSPDETKVLYEASASATIPEIIPGLPGRNSTPEERTLTPGAIYVYDAKEDTNYRLFNPGELDMPPVAITPTQRVATPTQTRRATATPTPMMEKPQRYPISWFPTNRHIMIVYPNKIDMVEYDRTNWVTVYAGPFSESFATPWPDNSRIMILTNLNPGTLSYPNFYTVNLR